MLVALGQWVAGAAPDRLAPSRKFERCSPRLQKFSLLHLSESEISDYTENVQSTASRIASAQECFESQTDVRNIQLASFQVGRFVQFVQFAILADSRESVSRNTCLHDQRQIIWFDPLNETAVKLY